MTEAKSVKAISLSIPERQLTHNGTARLGSQGGHPHVAILETAPRRQGTGSESLRLAAGTAWERISSNDASLYVSPDPISSAELLSSDWKGFAGDYSDFFWDTGHVWEICRCQDYCKVFPADKQFVDRVIAEGIVPASSFPSGPFPNDKLTYRGKRIVEF